jgi:hypothetical protein
MKAPPKVSTLIQSETVIRWLELCAAAGAIGLVFWKLQFSTQAICCGDFDGYYHIKCSRMLWDSLRSQTFPPIFTWLPFTTLDPNHYVDHHLFFHFLQIPFTWFRDLRMGAKVASTIFAAIAMLSCYWLLVRYRIRYSLVWLVALLACSVPFLYRLNMTKAPPFAIIYLVVAIHLLFKKKYWPLIPLAFIFTLTYDMFPLLVVAAFFWVVVIAWTEHRFEWRPVVWVSIGVIAGLVINPYFPQNLHLLYEHVRMKVTPADFATKVGQEWYPYDTWEFLVNSVVAMVAMLVGYIAFDPADRKRAHHSFFFLLFATTLMLMTARWKRIAEYWPPFAVMFAAFSLQPWLKGGRSIFTRLPSDIMAELAPFLDRDDPAEVAKEADRKELWRTLAAAVVAVILGSVLFFNLRATMKDIAASKPHEHYQKGAEWMRANIPSGQIVFNINWDDFPRLFFYDPTHNYISGLDPNYLYDKDPALSRLYDRITLGEQDDPGPLIRDRFRSRYVFTDNGHHKFYNNAIESGWFEIVYEDSECTILHIREQKGEPPTEEPEPDALSDEEPEPTNEQANQP